MESIFLDADVTRLTHNSGKGAEELCLHEEKQLTSRFWRQRGSCRKGFLGRGRGFQKTASPLISHLRRPQLNCKQWRKSGAPDDKGKLCNRRDPIHSSLSHNGEASWQGYPKTNPGITSFYWPYSLAANICSQEPHNLTSVKLYLPSS